MTRDVRSKSIGIFDSGIGGLTVANAIHTLLPDEHLIYFGDTAHMPYGEKSSDAIRFFSLKISKFLLEQHCKMIVIACNTASSAAYHTLLDFFEGRVLFVNVVDPLVDTVVDKGYEHIGVIATKATIRSNIYRDKIKHKLQKASVHSLATPLLAPMIEEGFFEGKISDSVISAYLDNEAFKNLDALLLACTHYPLIKDEIKHFLGDGVDVLDSTVVTAEMVKRILEDNDLLSSEKSAEDLFYVSDLTPSFADTAKMFYGKDISLEIANIW